MTKPIRCSGCEAVGCVEKSYCEPFRGKLRSYGGIRFTADGFDCALPVAMDSHSTCSYRCLYCFSNYLTRDPVRKASCSKTEDAAFKVGQWSLNQLEKILDGGGDSPKLKKYYDALVEVGVGSQPYRCPIQWGALGDPFDRIERHQGFALKAMPIFEKYDQPVRISTKGGDLLLHKRYLEAFKRRPELYWIAFSIISIDDEVLAKVDKDAPPASIRLKAMKAMSELGVQTSLRFRPIIPGISDSTPRVKHAWRKLLRAAAEAGARAVSMEITFVPGTRPPHIKKMWKEVEDVSGHEIVGWFYKTTSVYGACLRSSAAWKEDITYAIRDEAHKLGMTFAISDPHWKQLNDYGCCCGIPPDDPVFGKWQIKQATNAIVLTRDGIKDTVSAEDGIPKWAYDTRMDELVALTGPGKAYDRHHFTWADKLRDTWNDIRSPRGPLLYFEGALIPVDRKQNGDVVYKYRGLRRKKKKLETPIWKL